MTIAKYCKNKGMTLEEYETFKNNIQQTAKAIQQQQNYTHGMYYPVNDIITYSPNSEIFPFIIQELKKLGFEFIENYTLYRY
jgi:hypothetical protein